MKKCLNCLNPVPPYFVKFCSVYCRSDIRQRSRLIYTQYRKRYCERCLDKPYDLSKLHVHHLNENPGDNRPDNLITVCQLCHTTLHQATQIQFIKRKKKRRRQNKRASLNWLVNYYSVPGGNIEALPKQIGILDRIIREKRKFGK
jgi:HNH endonuclease